MTMKVRISSLPILMVLVSATVIQLKSIDVKAVDPAGGEKKNTSPSCPGNEVVIQRVENITKSSQDTREYRFLKLNNELQVLLISHPGTDMSAATMVVNSGWIDSLRDLPGCSHFLEHMLFMGSGKFPQENEYIKFITEHAGSYNGCTQEELTTFYFEISPNSLAETVDRLVQFFIDPLMQESSLEKEAKIVDAEYKMKATNDAMRMLQLTQHLSKPDHPNNVFACGNLTTLYTEPKAKGINIREKLFELYDKHYSSNVMYLAVYGAESLNDLENIVVPLVKNVENKKITPKTFKFPEDHPWGAEQLKKKIYIVPIMDTNMVEFVFATPDVISQYQTAPDSYINNVLGYGGAGSLISTFKSKDLCDVGGDYYSTVGYKRFAGCGFFKIRFSLTVEAMKRAAENINYIAETLFQYIQLVKTQGIQKWMFDENLKKSQLSFKFQDQSSPSTYLDDITPYIKYARPEDILSIFYLQEKWEPKTIEDFLNLLRPDNMNILIQSQSFKDIADQTEPYIGAQYKEEPISGELIQKWSQVGLNPDLQLPDPNKLLAENLDLYPIENDKQKTPSLLRESEVSQFWFLQDTVYKLPKLIVKFEIFSPTASSSTSPENSVLAHIFCLLFTDSMEEYTYLARQAELSWTIRSNTYGLQIELSGYNDKLSILLEKILSEILVFKVNEKRLTTLKEAYVLSLKNFETKSLTRISQTLIENLMQEKSWTNEELLKATETVQSANIEKFRTEMFSCIYMQGLIYGNANKKTALDIVTTVEKPFLSAKFAPPEQLAMLRRVQLNSGSNFVYEKLNNCRPNSFYSSYFELGPGTLRNTTLLKLVAQIIEEPMFTTLRTKEQLCYYTGFYVASDGGILGYTLEMESDKHPAFQSYRILEFLGSIKKIIEDMTDKEFETQKTSVKETNLKMPKNYLEMSSRLWDEIANRFYLFDRLEKEVEELKSITKDELIAFYEMTMSKTCEQRRMSVYIISQVTKPTVPAETPTDKSTKIPDIAAFRNTVTYFSYPPPSIEIAPLGSKNGACSPSSPSPSSPAENVCPPK